IYVDMKHVDGQMVPSRDADEGGDVNMGPIGETLVQAGGADEDEDDNVEPTSKQEGVGER
ncbi:hypothetical protein MKX01_012995, partial [Papaver californicum]